MNRSSLHFLCLTALAVFTASIQADEAVVNVMQRLPQDVSKRLVEAHKPDRNGALGRNRNSYIHARFQLGVHRLADYAVATQDDRALEAFLRATEYAFRHQNADGSFRFVIPPNLAAGPQPNEAELASGTAFFCASAGSGLWLLDQFASSPGSRLPPSAQTRLKTIRERLPATLEYLKRHREGLSKIDQRAPNRLLYDALAFVTLGRLTADADAIAIGESFANNAMSQQHDEGYFIEGGGYDSSYNGVATSLAYRLGLISNNQRLIEASDQALAWQVTRIDEQGQILTAGNARVHAAGEAFMGRQKDVDVGCTLESLALAAAIHRDAAKEQLARRVIGYYADQMRRGTPGDPR